MGRRLGLQRSFEFKVKISPNKIKSLFHCPELQSPDSRHMIPMNIEQAFQLSTKDGFQRTDQIPSI